VIKGIKEEHFKIIDQIAIEVHKADNRLSELRTILTNNGFECVEIPDPDVLFHLMNLTNVFATRKGCNRKSH